MKPHRLFYKLRHGSKEVLLDLKSFSKAGHQASKIQAKPKNF